MALVYCAPKLEDGFSQTASDIALMTGSQQHQRRAVLERYHRVARLQHPIQAAGRGRAVDGVAPALTTTLFEAVACG